MFDILFDSRRYYIRNNFTGLLLTDRSGKVKTFRSVKRAERYISRGAKRLNRIMRKINAD